MGLDRAAMHFQERFHERQADAQSAVRSVERLVHLREHLEDASQHLPRDARAVVDDRHSGISVFTFGCQPKMSLAPGIFGCVVQQVADNLNQTTAIAVDEDRLGRQVEGQLVTTRFDERPDSFDRLYDDVAEIEPLLTEFDLPASDPGHVEQVVDQPSHLSNLATHQGPHVVRFRTIVRDERPCLKRVAEGSERIPQFVRQRREKLIFAAVGLAEFPQSTRAFDRLPGSSRHRAHEFHVFVFVAPDPAALLMHCHRRHESSVLVKRNANHGLNLRLTVGGDLFGRRHVLIDIGNDKRLIVAHEPQDFGSKIRKTVTADDARYASAVVAGQIERVFVLFHIGISAAIGAEMLAEEPCGGPRDLGRIGQRANRVFGPQQELGPLLRPSAVADVRDRGDETDH
ncbi:MAG: hypothetical protein M3552_09300, partial [Planctomycetota bacterium]|nr:hypothetical protein [Planctomycetota bacterium]